MIYFLQAKKGNNEVDKSIGNVLYGIATKLKKQLAQHEPLLVQYAAKRKIVSNDQLDGKLQIDLNMSWLTCEQVRWAVLLAEHFAAPYKCVACLPKWLDDVFLG